MPFNDNYMRYDYTTHRYVLTVQYLTEVLGIDIEKRAGTSTLAQNMLNNALNRVSTLIYNYIYQFNDSQTINYIIATCPSARNIIKDIMGSQVLYTLIVGDLTLSTKADEREAWLDITAKAMIDNTEVAETGRPLSSSLDYGFFAPSYADGSY